MATPTDLVKDYINARVPVPQTPYTQEQSERYSAENEDGNNDEYRKRREFEEEPIPTREEYEANQREAEREFESNSRQRELDDLDDDLDQSEPDYDDNDNYLQDDEFSGNYFEKPDESEEKSSLGNRIREKYDSFRASASDTAQNLASSFGESFGTAAGVASAKYSRFKKGDPIFSVRSPPVRRGKSPSRYISRPGRNISKPYTNGRFGDDSFTLGTNAGYNPYYPVNAGRQSFGSDEPRDLYLPSGGAAYYGEFSGRKAFKQSEFSDERERERYDPFGYGGLSGDGFNNTGSFGSSLMSFGGDNSIFGGMSAGGTDTVFGNGAMFNAPRGKAKREANGFNLDLIIGDSGGMYNTTDPLPRKPTNKRKPASKRAKKASKAKPTRRKQATRKQPHNGFVLP